ncbi:hypothetical protein Tco_0475626 [Tanacetum coccineum]
MVESLPTMVDTHIKEQVKKQVWWSRLEIQGSSICCGKGSFWKDQKTKEEMERKFLSLLIPERPHSNSKLSNKFLKLSTISNKSRSFVSEERKFRAQRKIVLSLHKFPAIIFNDDDIEERTSRWVNKCFKKFNPYARYGVEHWKNPHAKIFYIKKQKEQELENKGRVYSNSKFIQVIKTVLGIGFKNTSLSLA